MKISLDFIERFALPILEEYWAGVIKRRKEKNYWFNNSPFLDIFKPLTLYDPKLKTGKKEFKFLCAIPASRCFWDVIIAIYIAGAPDLFPTHAKVCQAILESFNNLKIDFNEGYINFPEHVLFYLVNSMNGVEENSFLKDPASCLCSMLDILEKQVKDGEGKLDSQKKLIRDEISKLWEEKKIKKESDGRIKLCDQHLDESDQ